MANYCYYEVRAKGSEKARMLVYYSMPCVEQKEIIYHHNGEICFTGSCKWDIDYGVDEDKTIDFELSKLRGKVLETRGEQLWDVSLAKKARAFDCEIMVHSWSEESEFNLFVQYDNDGSLAKTLSFPYSDDYECSESFDWDLLEFKDPNKPNDDIAAYYAFGHGNEFKMFAVTYENPILKEILERYHYTSDSFENPCDLNHGKPLDDTVPDYHGVKTIRDFTKTLNSVLVHYGSGDPGMKEEMITRQEEIAAAFVSIDGTSQETFNEDIGFGQACGYDFQLENGVYCATYRTEDGGWLSESSHS